MPAPKPSTRHIYHASAVDPATPEPTWWGESAGPAPETDNLAAEETPRADIAVIGGGFTGLSAALHLARDFGADVRVLEAASPGWGASGRNGGFCGSGAAKLGYPRMIRTYGLEAAKAFHTCQMQAPELVRELLETEGIDAEPAGSAEISWAHKPTRLGELEKEQRFLAETFGQRTEVLPREALAERGIAGPEVHGGLVLPGHFGLHPLKYVHGLCRAARRHGARVHGGAAVVKWRTLGSDHLLETTAGLLRADRVIVATNGYTPEDLHERLAGRLLPALSNILVTRPLGTDEQGAQGWTSHDVAFDTRHLLHYMRLLPDGRFLFGGRGGTDASPVGRMRMRAVMERTFRRMFPAWSHVEFTHFWSGLVCLSYDLVPHIGPLDSEDARKATAWCGLAYHGSGVATATWTGRLLARLATGATGFDEGVPRVMRGAPPRFPFPKLRLAYLKLAYGAYHARDEWL